MSTTSFTAPASADRLERAATALRAHGFTVEVLDDAAAARTRIQDLIPAGAGVFTGASETLRRSGIEEDIRAGGRYDAIRPRVLAMDRATQRDARAAEAYGQPSAVNRLLVLNAEYEPGRGVVLLLREAIGF